MDSKKLPAYYTGKYKKIKAYEVISDYDLTYNIGTAVTYLLRSGKKPNNPTEQDIKKAINHLNFELEKLKLQTINDKNYINENTDSSYKCCKGKC